jgi:hypothetical protein
VEVGLDEWGRPTWVVQQEAEQRGMTTEKRGSGAETRSREEEGDRRDEGRRVEEVVETWIVQDEWWRTPIHRRYVEVVLEGGAHVVLFEDLATGEWFMQKP